MSGNTETPITITKSDKDHFETQTVYTDTINCNGCLTFTNTAESINNRTIGEHGTGNNSEIFNSYEGSGKNVASGKYSHAEGYFTTASGNYSHAEGYKTTASGKRSHAGGYYTIADYDNMTAIGKCNVSNDEELITIKKNKLFVVGNGNEENRMDAFIITEKGDVFIQHNLHIDNDLIIKGDLYVNGVIHCKKVLEDVK